MNWIVAIPIVAALAGAGVVAIADMQASAARDSLLADEFEQRARYFERRACDPDFPERVVLGALARSYRYAAAELRGGLWRRWRWHRRHD